MSDPVRKTDRDPAIDWQEVTEGTDALSPIPSSLFIGSAGDLTVTSSAGNQATFKNISAGTLLPIRPKYIDTASTVADLVAVY